MRQGRGSKMVRALLAVGAVAVMLGWSAMPVSAFPVTFTGTSGDLSASATFNVSGTDLIITLTNTSTHDVGVPSNVLTAIFFDLDPSIVGGLSRISAVVAPGSTVINGTTDPGGVGGGEWAYKDLSSSSGVPGNAGLGTSSSGLNLFGAGDLFPGTDLAGPPSGSPDGLQYGITSAGDDPLTGNAEVLGSALIKNSVIFTLRAASAIDLSTVVSNVTFQYGTALTEPHVPGTSVPEASASLMLGLSLSAVFGYAWFRRKQTGVNFTL